MNHNGLIASICLACLYGCATPPKPDPKAAAYAVELQLCVANAKTKSESSICRAQVDAKYNQCDGGCQ